MAASMVPDSGISLHGAPTGQAKGRVDSVLSRSAIVVTLNEQVIQDLQQCTQSGKTVQLLGGKFPRIRYGSKVLDLNVRPETFRHEIYSADKSSAADLAFTTLVSCQAEVKSADKKAEGDTAGPDAALAMLKQSLASAAQEKEARKVTISNSVIAAGKNRKPPAPSRSLLNRAAPGSSSNSSTPHHVSAPTSAPLGDAQARARENAMRTALIHLLAVKPTTEDRIFTQTRIPRTQLTNVLTKIAEKESSEWKLSNKSFKELDPWTFKYESERQRQAAIDNAIRAYDRLRIPKEDKSWQILLAKEDRGKGKVLSRLNLNVEKRDTAGTPGLTPGLTPVPSHATPNSAATPKLGPSASTPRSGATTATGRSGAGISVGKMIKDAKKQRAREEAKMAKAQQKEAAAASDRESKPRNVTAKRVGTIKKAPTTAKSEEIVRSSDDEDEGEIKEKKPTKTSAMQLKEPMKTALKPKSATERRDSSSSDASKPKAKAAMPLDNSSRISNAPYKSVSGSKLKTASKSNGSTPAARKSEDTTMTTKAKDTVPASTPNPTQRPVKAPVSSQSDQQKVSPKKADTKPKVPSPLGTTQPIQAVDKVDRTTKNAATKVVNNPALATAAKSKQDNKQAESPLNFFGGVKSQAGPIVTKKRALDSADEASEPARKITKTSTNATTKPATSSRLANTDSGLKSRANDTSSGVHDHGAPAATKHRKTDSSSTHSQAATNSSITSLTTAATASPSPSISSTASPHDSAKMAAVGGDGDGYSSTRVKLTYAQALDEAEKFKTKMYPVYLELYEKLDKTPAHLQSAEDVRKLWEMHGRLSMLKKEIFEAAE